MFASIGNLTSNVTEKNLPLHRQGLRNVIR